MRSVPPCGDHRTAATACPDSVADPSPTTSKAWAARSATTACERMTSIASISRSRSSWRPDPVTGAQPLPSEPLMTTSIARPEPVRPGHGRRCRSGDDRHLNGRPSGTTHGPIHDNGKARCITRSAQSVPLSALRPQGRWLCSCAFVTPPHVGRWSHGCVLGTSSTAKAVVQDCGGGVVGLGRVGDGLGRGFSGLHGVGGCLGGRIVRGLLAGGR